MLITAVLILVATFIISSTGTLLLKKFAPRLGLVDQPAARKLHARPMPLGGGLAIFAAFTLVVGLGAVVLPAVDGQTPWLPEVVRNHIGMMADKLPTLLTILGGGLVITAVGLIDDLRGLTPRLRLAIEAAIAAGLFILSPELRVTAFTPTAVAPFIYTVIWITIITNSFNLLDNMDGLSSGVATVASVIFLIAAVQTGQFFVAAMLLALIGSMLGFLIFNFPPASIFMGDSGALFIGYLISVLTVVFSFYEPSMDKSPFLSMLLPMVILAVPIFDTLSVIVIRLRTGQPIFKADKNHFSHRLVGLGMTRRQAVLTIYLVTFCTGIGAVFWYQASTVISLIIFAQAAATLGLVAILEITAARITKKQASAENSN